MKVRNTFEKRIPGIVCSSFNVFRPRNYVKKRLPLFRRTCRGREAGQHCTPVCGMESYRRSSSLKRQAFSVLLRYYLNQTSDDNGIIMWTIQSLWKVETLNSQTSVCLLTCKCR